MKLTRQALYFLPLFSTIGPTCAQNTTNTSATEWPILGTGQEGVVQWDHYSLIVNGKRVFLFGGEMHPWRLPVPEMWEDVLQKMKAAGLNSISFYSHWGYHAPTIDTLDFGTGGHNLTRLYELACDIGIFVTARPGPYINAETSAGGFPLWLTTGAYSPLRDNDSRYTAAWTPYQDAVARITHPFQVTQNGTALLYQIENEFTGQWRSVSAKTPNNAAIAYMKLLEANARSNGIDIPLTHNSPTTSGKSWSKDYDTVSAGGDVDIYGLDTVSPNQPSYLPEFQGGAVNPWDGPPGGCAEKSNQDFVNFYYRYNIAQKVTAMSLYMVYGGTNWGWLAVPFVPTSYDYTAPISEDRSIGAKYYEIKNLALFTRIAEDLRKADRIGASTSYSTNAAISATELRNPDTNAGFYVTIHSTTTSSTNESFRLKVRTSLGNYTIPQRNGSIVLNGHQSKIIVTDFAFGNETLIYSTAEVLTYAVFNGRPTLVLWVPTGESGEFYIEHAKQGSIAACNGCSNIIFCTSGNGLIVTFQQQEGMSVLQFDKGVRVLLLDRSAAYTFFVPGLTSDPLVPVDQTAFVQGPYLVRSAEVSSSTITLCGDSNQTSTIEVFAAKELDQISWNGNILHTNKTSYGSLKADISGPISFTAPKLGPWKVHDSLPERWSNYSDSDPAWVNANKTSTASSSKTATLPYLYIDEYGFHTGIHLWRGYFNGAATGVYLNVQGGIAHGWSAYLNGGLISSFFGSGSSATGNQTLSFANATLNPTGSNVLLVIQDNSGHDESASGARNVRGILNATLIGKSSTFSTWKVAGTAGGSSSTFLDPVRTIYNEGGLTAERLGWHLPGFDDSAWASDSPSQGFTGAGVKFYRTTVQLDAPDGHDVSLSFKFLPIGAVTFRALLYVNGYQYARFYPYITSVSTFPVPPGVLDYGGENLVAIALWAQTNEGATVDLDMNVNYVTQSSLNVKFDGTYLRPGWDARRLDYA
ncbi:glycoside hydrolase family 35 protein [Glonium stellatum]|uniref:beta-galactosidase n=1 Tax=Glonium stellatum TaxID=574774 RepID=A0A8E2FDW5_9PEZI|nr:glycoside hydrolase family 35 protein [Glonium stellatum]